jgi:hypothetical protein
MAATQRKSPPFFLEEALRDKTEKAAYAKATDYLKRNGKHLTPKQQDEILRFTTHNILHTGGLLQHDTFMTEVIAACAEKQPIRLDPDDDEHEGED